MRTTLLAATVIAAAGVAQAQSPTAKLPSQAELPTNPSTPNAGTDEVAARRKLEDQGYRDLRNVTPNGDGSFSARAVRQNPSGARPGINREVNVEIDASGNIRER
ncbi:MAG: hypothetical protein GEV13_26155 [Rhodospirillales bacterium]|nr:hypothetical protein [Rhodospirillales bacterium]